MEVYLKEHIKIDSKSHSLNVKKPMVGYGDIIGDILAFKVDETQIRFCTKDFIWVYNYDMKEINDNPSQDFNVILNTKGVFYNGEFQFCHIGADFILAVDRIYLRIILLPKDSTKLQILYTFNKPLKNHLLERLNIAHTDDIKGFVVFSPQRIFICDSKSVYL